MSAMMIKYFDVEQLDFEHFPEKCRRSTKQPIMLPTNGGDQPPIIQLPWIELSQCGVPTKSDCFKEDTQRYFIKLPLDDSEKSREVIKFVYNT